MRNQMVEEKITTQEKEEGSSWWNFTPASPATKETQVNAKDEAERIRKNEEQGKPITEGETPVVKDKDTGILGRIFGY